MIRPSLPRLFPSRFVGVRIACAILVGVLLAGCDKCGNRVKFNAPTLPNSCGANADPAR